MAEEVEDRLGVTYPEFLVVVAPEREVVGISLEPAVIHASLEVEKPLASG